MPSGLLDNSFILLFISAWSHSFDWHQVRIWVVFFFFFSLWEIGQIANSRCVMYYVITYCHYLSVLLQKKNISIRRYLSKLLMIFMKLKWILLQGLTPHWGKGILLTMNIFRFDTLLISVYPGKTYFFYIPWYPASYRLEREEMLG